MRLSVKLADPPSLPSLMKRTLKVRIPDRLSLRRGKVRVQVSARTGDPLELIPSSQITTVRQGRSMEIGFSPSQIYDLDTGFSSVPPNTNVTFNITLKRGSLQPLTPRTRRARPSFRLRGANIGGRWYGDGISKKSVKVKPARR